MPLDDESEPGKSAAELLERYLGIVAFWLPRAEKRDIRAELEGDIRSAVEEREAELGRALEKEEMEALLERWGHPLRVAGRYLPRRHLIGPELFPLYAFVLKVVALVYLVPWLIAWLGLVAFSPAYRAAHPGLELPGTLGLFARLCVYAFAAITFAFALLERRHARSGFPLEWDPHEVRAPASDASGARGPSGPRGIPRTSSAAQVVIQLVFLAWWLQPRLPSLPAQDGTSGPWIELYECLFLPLLLLSLANLALACFNWVRPRWTRARYGLRALLHGGCAALLIAALLPLPDVAAEASGLAAARSAGAESEAMASVARLASFGLLLVIAGGCALAFLIDSIRAARWRNAPARTACALGAAVALLASTPEHSSPFGESAPAVRLTPTVETCG